MRTLAMMAAVSIAALFAAGGAWAWTQEQTAQGSPNGTAVDLSDPENFQALQDKVNGKTQSQSGFQVYTGSSSGSSPFGMTRQGGRLPAFTPPPPAYSGNGE